MQQAESLGAPGGQAQDPTSPESARRASFAGAPGIWGLTAALWAIAAALFMVVVRDLPGRPMSFHIPLLAMVALFYVLEANAVHLRAGGDARSFTLSEIPLVIGLFVLTPSDLVLARLIGAMLALAQRDQQPIKLAFNLGFFALETNLAAILFEALWGAPRGLEPLGWGAAFLTVAITNFLGSLVLAVVISMSQKQWQLRTLPSVIGLGTIISIGNASLALLALTMLRYEPRAAWLLMIPTAIVFAAYRAYAAEREKRDGLKFLYETTRMLSRSPQTESALIALLQQARDMFKAGMAEIVLFPSSWNGAALRTALGPGDEIEVMRPMQVGPSEELRARAIADGQARHLKRPQTSLGPDHRWSPHIKDALIAPLQGESRVIGTMMVGNRIGELATFDADDVRLFGTLANHASVSLENGRLERSLTRLRELQEQLRHQATHDPLTGLANRALLNERVSHALDLLDRSSGSVAVLALDLDDFKTVNDSLGHGVGDELLVLAAQRLRDCIRPGDTVARHGGDEFTILLENVHSVDETCIVANRVISCLEPPFSLQEKEVSVRASVGVALSAGGGESTAEILGNADVAMYAAKRAGKDRFQIYAPDMHHAAVTRLKLKGDLQHALQHDEMKVVYQPIVDLEQGRITGIEALLRWQHPYRGQVQPLEFLSLAEETGLIIPLGGWVLRTALEQVAEWQTLHSRPINVSINLSARELQKSSTVDEIAQALRETGVEPSRVTLEITETSLMKDTEATLDALRQLKEIGLCLAIDDFGTGYSSLSYLERFPVDTLKIDKSFIDNISRGPDTVLAHAVVKIGEAMGLTTVAEGIESHEQLAELRELKCDMGQGFLFAPPLPPEEIEILLDDGARPLVDLRMRD
jgi:diguanylate cyclase (GGDEF)-like protein